MKLTSKKILVKQLEEWRENEAMMQKKKTHKKMEDDKSGDASMDDVATFEGKFKVGTSKSPSDSRALAVGFLLKDGKDTTSQFYGKTMMTKTMAARISDCL